MSLHAEPCVPTDVRELAKLTNAAFEQMPDLKVMLGGIPRQTLIYSREGKIPKSHFQPQSSR